MDYTLQDDPEKMEAVSKVAQILVELSDSPEQCAEMLVFINTIVLLKIVGQHRDLAEEAMNLISENVLDKVMSAIPFTKGRH